MTWFDIALGIVGARVLMVLAVLGLLSLAFVGIYAYAMADIAWMKLRQRFRPKPKPPTFKQISDALERDIAAAEAKGIKVDRTERMTSRPRIRF